MRGTVRLNGILKTARLGAPAGFIRHRRFRDQIGT